MFGQSTEIRALKRWLGVVSVAGRGALGIVCRWLASSSSTVCAVATPSAEDSSP